MPRDAGAAGRRPRLMLSLLAATLVTYGAVVVLLFAAQRLLLYPGAWDGGGTSLAGLAPPGFRGLLLTTEDGEELTAWWRPPEPGRAAVLYFQGNGGNLAQRRGRAAALAEGGRGVLLLSYRGFSGSTGSPSAVSAWKCSSGANFSRTALATCVRR